MQLLFREMLLHLHNPKINESLFTFHKNDHDYIHLRPTYIQLKKAVSQIAIMTFLTHTIITLYNLSYKIHRFERFLNPCWISKYYFILLSNSSFYSLLLDSSRIHSYAAKVAEKLTGIKGIWSVLSSHKVRKAFKCY